MHLYSDWENEECSHAHLVRYECDPRREIKERDNASLGMHVSLGMPRDLPSNDAPFSGSSSRHNSSSNVEIIRNDLSLLIMHTCTNPCLIVVIAHSYYLRSFGLLLVTDFVGFWGLTLLDASILIAMFLDLWEPGKVLSLVGRNMPLLVHSHSSQEALKLEIPLVGLLDETFINNEEAAPIQGNMFFMLLEYMNSQEMPLWSNAEAEVTRSLHGLFDGILGQSHFGLGGESNVEIC